jgi:hypothetical protein
MAIRFARQAGNWSNPLTWDDGLTIPTTGDEVYLNNYNIIIDQDVTTGFISNSQTPIGVPLDPIPDMISNTSPVGVGQAFATQNNINAWKVFVKGLNTFVVANSAAIGWQSGINNTGQIGYQFNTPKSIQRYSIYNTLTNSTQRPSTWTFEGSNDGVTWTILHTVTGLPSVLYYISPTISNPSSYVYYRVNVTTTVGGGQVHIYYISMSESTSFGDGYLSVGSATISTSRTVNTDLYHSSGTLINISAAFPNTVNITGNIPGTKSASSSRAINISNNCTVNYVGDIVSAAILGIAGTTGIQASSGILNITGNVTGGALTSFSTSTAGIRASSGTINIVGNVYATFAGTRDNNGIVGAANGTINITGQVYGSTSAISTPNIGINLAGVLLTIVGNINAANGSPAIYGPLISTTILLYGDAINSPNGTMAAICPFLFLENVNFWEFRKSNLTTNTLYTPGVATGHPAESNVRTGIVYGPTSDLTGTCAVPPAAAVSLGVPVDNTVGTAELTASDMWNYDLVNVNNQPGTVGYTLKKIQPQKIRPQIIMNIGNIVT